MKEYIRRHSAVKLICVALIAILALTFTVVFTSAEETIPQSSEPTAPFTQGSLEAGESEPPANDAAGGGNSPVIDENGGGEVNTPPPSVDEPSGEENGVTEDTGEAVNIFTRLFEYAELYFDEILTAVSVVVMGAYSLYQRRKNGTLISGIGRVLKSQGGVESASQLVSEAMKRLEEKQEQMNRYYEEYSKNEGERNKVTAALLVEVMALIEVQHIAYINNSNIPQSMKNLMTSKYARCLSAINDDAELKATYDEMRGILGISEGKSNEAQSS